MLGQSQNLLHSPHGRIRQIETFVGTAGLTSLLDWIPDEPFGGTVGWTTASHEKCLSGNIAGAKGS